MGPLVLALTRLHEGVFGNGMQCPQMIRLPRMSLAWASLICELPAITELAGTHAALQA